MTLLHFSQTLALSVIIDFQLIAPNHQHASKKSLYMRNSRYRQLDIQESINFVETGRSRSAAYDYMRSVSSYITLFIM